MKVSTLYKLTYIYLTAPLLIFTLTWLNSGCAVLWTLVLGCAFYKAYQQSSTETSAVPASQLTLIISTAALWCFFAGIGYFYYQSFDYHFRNAVFRDLINYNWPVFYDQADTPLVYYIAFWLIPAAITKFFSLFIADQQTLFICGNIVLYLYAVFGTSLLFAHISFAVKSETKKQLLIALLVFIFFSGLDIIGYLFFQTTPQPFAYHLDWWATTVQYSSITTSQFWVFNQFIPTALLILLVYNEGKVKNFGFLIALALFFAPYPAFGIGLFMLAFTTEKLLCATPKFPFVKQEIFSVQNIIGVFWFLPLLILYFITNSGGIDRWHHIFNYITLRQLALFMMLEFALYAAILLPQYRKDIYFKTLCASLLFIPLLRLDQQNNFCMRASIPAIIMLAIFIVRYLLSPQAKLHRGKTLLLLFLLVIGSATPLTEFYRGFHNIAQTGKIALVQDDIYTLNRRNIRMPVFGFDVNHQFTAQNYRTDIFWQYLSTLPKR